MRILFINVSCGRGSTGRICVDLAQQYEAEGHTCKIAYGREGYMPPNSLKYAVSIGSEIDSYLHAAFTRVFDKHGLYSKLATKKFLRWADSYAPDVLWLHNIHGYYINYELLFGWIKSRPNMQVKWTLHDCWAFTGHCAHFSAVKCYKWKAHCNGCPQKTSYPTSKLFDNSSSNFERKKKAFCGVKNMTLYTPSKWLADLVKESFLKGYPIEVLYNKVDKDIFKPTPSDFRAKYKLEDKKIILGVSSVWNDKKGLQDFLDISKRLDCDKCIVLVGLTEKQFGSLPSNILGIKKTESQQQLAEI